MTRHALNFRQFPFKLILGSASPRRQELLKSLGFEFSLQPTHADESFPSELVAHEIPVYLAEKKAAAYSGELENSEVLITADTVVWCDGRVLNKPADYEEGEKMLTVLSGRMHEVFTAVCLKTRSQQITFFDTTKVYFKQLTSDEIDYYLKNYSPYDKAGSYGAQDWMGYVGIDRIEGSFYNVMGLPVKLLYEELMKL